MRKRLTNAVVDSLKPKSRRYLVYDSVVSGLAVRVSPSGCKTYVLVGRHGAKHATRRSLGFGITLDDARIKAQSCHRNGALPKLGPTFGEVAEKFLLHVQLQKRVSDVRYVMNRDFLPRWRECQFREVKRADILEVIDAALARGAPYAAHHAWAHCRRLYNWAIARGIVEHSPCDRVRPRDIIGEKVPRQRVLTDDEIARVWLGAGQLGYPMGPCFHLLMVTGQRRTEVSHARRCEFDLPNRLWQLPASRMKAGAPHMVPLSPLAMTIIEGLPQHEGYLFSTDAGRKPVNGFSKAKKRLDATVGVTTPFVVHDIRRTVRTRLSQLRVRHEVAEMVIGHGKKGLARVYDQHQYRDEIREALDLWAIELMRIVERYGAGRAEVAPPSDPVAT